MVASWRALANQFSRVFGLFLFLSCRRIEPTTVGWLVVGSSGGPS